MVDQVTRVLPRFPWELLATGRRDVRVKIFERVILLHSPGFIDRVFSRSWQGLWNTIKLKVIHYNLCHAGAISV